MTEPIGSRPYMPGYGTLDAHQGTGLLAWSWARERLERSHDYWVATTRPSGQPHVMPVWGVWLNDRLWFSSSRGSRKARNLGANPNCAITTDNPYEPVVIEGTAELVQDLTAIAAFVAAINWIYPPTDLWLSWALSYVQLVEMSARKTGDAIDADGQGEARVCFLAAPTRHPSAVRNVGTY